MFLKQLKPFVNQCIFVLCMSLATSATAQVCDCPGQKVIDTFKIMIADRQAKLTFLKVEGNFETASGFSNIPEILQQEIAELERIIEKRAAGIVKCRLQCMSKGVTEVADQSLGLSQTININECPKCYGAYLRYIYEQDFGIANKGLGGLIRCNLLHCRPQNATSTFRDGDIPDISPIPTDEPENDTNDQEPGETATTSTGDQSAGVVPGPALITVPNFPAGISRRPAPNFPPDTFRQLTGTCDYDPQDMCDKLGENAAGECVGLVQKWTQECKSVFPRTKLPSIALCQAECGVFASEATASLEIRELVLSVINVHAGSLVTKARRELLDEKQSLEARLEILGLELAEQVVHLYQNENSGNIVEHFGAFFEPNPPLTYVGERPAPPSAAQLSKIKVLSESLEEISQKLLAIRGSAQETAWQDFARSIWLGKDAASSPIGCTQEQIAPKLAECRAFCAQQGERTDTFVGPHVKETCQPISIMGMLYLPLSRQWIYPKGNPWRNPGYGR